MREHREGKTVERKRRIDGSERQSDSSLIDFGRSGDVEISRDFSVTVLLEVCCFCFVHGGLLDHCHGVTASLVLPLVPRSRRRYSSCVPSPLNIMYSFYPMVVVVVVVGF